MCTDGCEAAQAVVVPLRGGVLSGEFPKDGENACTKVDPVSNMLTSEPVLFSSDSTTFAFPGALLFLLMWMLVRVNTTEHSDLLIFTITLFVPFVAVVCLSEIRRKRLVHFHEFACLYKHFSLGLPKTYEYLRKKVS